MIALQISSPCVWAALAGLVALMGMASLVGAAAAVAWMSDARATCADLRAESHAINAESLDAALQTKTAITQWACTMRGGLCK